jgi:alkylated DNA repair dioxygenase AlkB
MKLFDDVALFDTGSPRYTEFTLPGTELKLWEQFYGKAAADRYFHILLSETPWQQHYRKMYDKMVADPRLIAYYGGEGLPWTDTLLEIKQKVEATSGIAFNRVLLNYYRNGNDSVAWHSDTLPADGRHHAIASVTFGETRLFKIRHKTDRRVQQLDIPLTHGSFLLMGETMQCHYEHHIPKTAKQIGPRINLTFRIGAGGA